MSVHLTDNTKISKVDNAFGELVKDFVTEGNPKKAKSVLDAFAELPADSKVRLYDILTK